MKISERAEAARAWLKANPQPLQELCPELNQHWRNARYEIVCWNSKTGRRETYDPCDFAELTRWRSNGRQMVNPVSVRSEYEGFYLRYVEDLDALEIADVYFPGNRGVDGVVKNWRYESNSARRLIFHNDPVAYGCETYRIWDDGKYYSKSTSLYIRSMNSALRNNACYEEFKKYNGGYPAIGWDGMPADVLYPWILDTWYVRNNVARKQSKNSGRLTEIKLRDIDPPFLGKAFTIVYERVDDDLSVLRMFEAGVRSYDYQTQNYSARESDRKTEMLRVFITDKGKVSCLVPRNREWRITSNVGGLWGGTSAALANESEMLGCKPLKYILPVIDTDCNNAWRSHKEAVIKQIIIALRHPVIEQLSKAGYAHIATELMMDNQTAAHLKKYFCVDKEKNLPLYKLLGVNKYILQAAEKLKEHSLPFILEIKKLYDCFDVSFLDEETIETLHAAYSSNQTWRLTGYYPGHYVYWRNAPTACTEEERAKLLKLFRMHRKDERILPLWWDTNKMFRSVVNPPDVDLFSVRNYEELLRLHDALTALYATQQAERRAHYDASAKERIEMRNKTFERLQKDRIAAYEYENDKFAIRVPKDLGEITAEGVALRHCVGGYVDDHGMGRTNILFLRRKEDETRSFYTMEIRGDSVIQIHGYCNKWLGNDPDAVPFMYEYLQQLGVKFDKTMLLNTGAGYGRGAEYLPESALYTAVPALGGNTE